MKSSNYKTYDELPLFLNAESVALALGVSESSVYELMHEPGFPVLKVGKRMVVPKDRFRDWVEQTVRGSVSTDVPVSEVTAPWDSVQDG